LQHMKLEGVFLDAISIGIVGGVFVIFCHRPFP
jgi:hypothetical protein